MTNKLIQKIDNFYEVMQEMESLRGELKAKMRKEQEDAAAKGLNWASSGEKYPSDQVRDKLIGIVNTWFDDVQEIVEFLHCNKAEIIEIYNCKKTELDELDNDTQKKLDKILSDDNLSDKFFNETLPQSLMEDFGITRPEYDEMLKNADMKADKEELLEDIMGKIVEKEKTMKFRPFKVSEALQEPGTIYTSSKWF